jgi:hypothetical protein
VVAIVLVAGVYLAAKGAWEISQAS